MWDQQKFSVSCFLRLIFPRYKLRSQKLVFIIEIHCTCNWSKVSTILLFLLVTLFCSIRISGFCYILPCKGRGYLLSNQQDHEQCLEIFQECLLCYDPS